MRKISSANASDILTRTTLDEVPEGYRGEVWVEEDDDGEVVDNWFVGSEGAISYSGTMLTLEEWEQRKEEGET